MSWIVAMNSMVEMRPRLTAAAYSSAQERVSSSMPEKTVSNLASSSSRSLAACVSCRIRAPVTTFVVNERTDEASLSNSPAILARSASHLFRSALSVPESPVIL